MRSRDAAVLRVYTPDRKRIGREFSWFTGRFLGLDKPLGIV